MIPEKNGSRIGDFPYGNYAGKYGRETEWFSH